MSGPVGRAAVTAARRRTVARLVRTPVLAVSATLAFKLEYLQHAGSFKTRGMLNRLLTAAEAGRLTGAGIVAASGGNAGLAAAYAARELGRPAHVYVPVTAPAVKLARLDALGATVTRTGAEYADAYAAAVEHAAATGALLCHAYDDPAMVAGNGTVALELAEDLPGGYDTVLVAVGGGGLLAGVAAATGARVVAVEPERCATLHAALAAGGPVDVPVAGVAADALGARRAGRIAYATAVAAGIGSVLVDDAAIVHARRRLWSAHRIVVEHGTAAAYAALTAGAYRPEPGERTVVLLCGANTDPADLAG